MKLVDLGIFVVVFIVLVSFSIPIVRAQLAQRRPPVDVSRRPSDWWTDSRELDGSTHVSIVRVARDDGEILERRTLESIRDNDPQYKELLDKALDRAYETQRVANVHLHRR